MKMFYEDPEIEVMLLDVVDVITASAGDVVYPDDEYDVNRPNIFG